MSWVKRRGQSTPSPAAMQPSPVQMYNPNQHPNQENHWEKPDQQVAANTWYQQNQQKQQYSINQPSPQTNYWPMYNQTPAPQMYNQNTNQYGQFNQDQANYYQNPGYQQQNYGNLQYNQPNNSYAPQHMQQKSETDAWNWGWGDEDNSNVHSQPTQATNVNTTQVTNNITESFANDETWNWSVGESNSTSSLNYQNQESQVNTNEEMFPKMGKYADKHNTGSEMQEENSENNIEPSQHVQNLNLDQLPSLTGKRGKVDNLTPQWSIESQISQESSDDILHTSESDKSHMLSRSSTISQSPISGQDINADVFVPHKLQETNSHYNLEENATKHEKLYEHNNTRGFSNLPQHENKEILSTVKQETSYDGIMAKTQIKTNITPPPPMKNKTPPLLPQVNTSDDTKNPYKRNSSATKMSLNRYSDNQQIHYFSNQSEFATSFNQPVNLETVPDNSEQPDSLPSQNTQPVRKVSVNKNSLNHWPDNNEVAPINDRNQYLETGQLSNVDINSYDQVSESLNASQDVDVPPVGLRRMVLGQMESHELNLNMQDNIGDEPPPGLSRMVLGQTESSLSGNQTQENEIVEPPVGLHRMIPGESSSPESGTRQQGYVLEHRLEDDYVSETELNQLNSNVILQQRSATIGADTPPSITNLTTILSSQNTNSVNRSETIGADTPPSLTSSNNEPNRVPSNASSDNRIGAIGLDVRETNADGENIIDETVTSNSGKNRRDSIEGQPRDMNVTNLVNTMRDLTVGENPTDGAISGTVLETKSRRQGRQESSDSELDHRVQSPRDRRDKRRKEDRNERDKNREHYSPDSYRDKKYDRRKYRDRRYEDDTDYYSDKDRELRNKEDKIRREDYERKYNSLRRDKDKDKRRRDGRGDYGRETRRGDYYNRYEDEYENESRSRPSSRSDSLHEPYRERGHDRDPRRHREREREHHRRHRDPMNSYMQGFGYDPYNPYYQYQYQYYENLRRTNPQAYAEMYRKYYQQAAAGHSGTYGAEDRASVHSGRSSANDELAKDRYTRQSYYSQSSFPHMGSYYRESHSHSISGQYGLDDSSYNRPFDHTDSSLNFEDNNLSSQRLTPAKFTTAHIKASIESGHLVKVLPNYPLDGQPAAVEIINIQALLVNDDVYKELINFPGPLAKGVTHKKTIIEYCENKIRNAACTNEIVDPESYILLWELLILLIRQNGMVVGADIAELLMKDRNENVSNRSPSVASTVSSAAAEISISTETLDPVIATSSRSALKEEVVTSKFREYLIYGSGKEALEWAMKHGLWGHALFLASKLDKRTYANVMMRFANGLTMNDPLQTLYQLLSGRLPAAVTCVADEKWGDWRPHLAMILSNTTQRPELDRKAITTLADTLLNRGSLYASQFCYLMADVGFSRYGSPGAKLVLLGSNHNKPFTQFATDEAIHMTEVYEYACSLNDGTFIINEFQQYKYLLATRLADRGLPEKALSYLETMTSAILNNPKVVEPSLIDNVCVLADRLKYNDPIEDPDDSALIDSELDTSRPGNSWLKALKTIQNDYNMGLITHESNSNILSETPELDQQKDLQAYDQNASSQGVWQQQSEFLQQQWQPEQQSQAVYQQNHQAEQLNEGYSASSQPYQDSQQYWPNQQQQWAVNSEVTTAKQQQTDYWNHAQTEPDEVKKEQSEDVGRPQISMPNQAKGQKQYEELSEKSENNNYASKGAAVTSKVQQIKQDKPTTGWFGGIWSKLALRPKNQMKLPDDKNPTIVWDPEKKRWTNLEEESNESSNEIKPPPKMSDMFTKVPQQNFAPSTGSIAQEQENSAYPNMLSANQPDHFGVGQIQQPVNNNQEQMYAPSAQKVVPAAQMNVPTVSGISTNQVDDGGIPKPSQPNMFKMQRNRNLKKSYVDVFNPGGKTTGGAAAAIPTPDVFGALPSTRSQMNFFVPQPITDPNAPTDFLTPAQVGSDDQAQMSRWSSASSLSREVQHYMRQKPPVPP